MKTLQPNHFIVNQFWLAFRKGAHKLIWMGYQRAMVRIRATSDEESVTGFLYEAISEIIKYGDDSWCQKYEAKNENPLPSSLRTGKSRRKTDLIILHVFKKAHPEFVFEAKALNSSKKHQLEDNYLNEDGLKRFLKGDYADYTARYPEVAMVGYIFSDTLEEWQRRLKSAIDNRTKELSVSGPQNDIKIIDELRFEWKSNHTRDTGHSDLAIYHILLSCC
jgi:hypothetical protein